QQVEKATQKDAEESATGGQTGQTSAVKGTEIGVANELTQELIPIGEEPANIRIAREAKVEDDKTDRGTLNTNTIPLEKSISDLPPDYDPNKVKFNVQT